MGLISWLLIGAIAFSSTTAGHKWPPCKNITEPITTTETPITYVRCINSTGNANCRQSDLASIGDGPCLFEKEYQEPKDYLFQSLVACVYFVPDPTDPPSTPPPPPPDLSVRPGKCCFYGPVPDPRNRICEAICSPPQFYINNIIRNCPAGMFFDLDQCICDWEAKVTPSPCR